MVTLAKVNLRPPSCLLACAVSLCGASDLSEPHPAWWAPPFPRLDAVIRPDAGMAGQGESATPISDQAVLGGAYTRVHMRISPGSASTGDQEWTYRATRFGLETVAGLPGGWALGLHAIDDQIVHHLEKAGARWEITEPRGGLRLGGGVNFLERWSPDHEWVWGASIWTPFFDRTGEREIQTGLRRGRRWRLDGAFATRTLAQEARRADDRLDTSSLRGEETRWSVRWGAQSAAGNTIQLWGGMRIVEEGRPEGDDRSVGLASRSTFLGAQGTFSRRKWVATWESRVDLGDDTLRQGDGNPVQATVRHRLGAGELSLDAPWMDRYRPGVVVSGAVLDLSEGECRGEFPQLPSGVKGDGGGSLQRWGASALTRIRTSWVDVVPRVGIHHVAADGELPQVWTGLWPLGEGSGWLGEFGIGVVWKGSAGSASYHLGGTSPLGRDEGVDPGFTHRLEMRQGF